MDISKISKDNIKNIQFSSIDPVEYPAALKVNYRISGKDLADLPPTDETKQAELRIRIIEIFEEKLSGQTTKVEEYCDINRTLFSKYLHAKAPISKTSLVKFIIGLKLDYNEGLELLELNGTPINEDCRFDYIAMSAIKDKDELEDFDNDLVKYGCKSILSN